MTVISSSQPKTGLISRLVSVLLSIKPLANFAKAQARQMMIKRAEKIGVPWRANVEQLRQRQWDQELGTVQDPEVDYPEYYLTSFHAYDEGNLSWTAAWEVESAAQAVHAKIWTDDDPKGDTKLRRSYQQALTKLMPIMPQDILDLGCGVGMSTMSLQEVYPSAKVMGLDLSPYFLSVAQYRGQKQQPQINWIHGAAEATGLPGGSLDLVATSLMFHELPASAAQAIILEAHRLLRPGGYLAIMDMNPISEAFKKMPPYVFTLLKSTEPYLDQYFALDLEKIMNQAGFTDFKMTINSPRHRTVVARRK
ncbi:MAG: class I SAM-dependent methyltransferase [Cyanobacteria bacterium J06621_8]